MKPLVLGDRVVSGNGTGAASAPVVWETTGAAVALIRQLEVEVMIRVVEDRSFPCDIAAQGIENSKRFSWLRCSQETLAVLTEAAAAQ